MYLIHFCKETILLAQVNAAEISLDNTTSVGSTKESTKAIAPDYIYDLRGMKLKAPKGIYIRGGKVRVN